MSDNEDLMPQVFVVEGDEDEFDLDIPPTSGMEYLRRVQLETAHQPLVIVADIDKKKYSRNQTIGVKAKDIQTALPAPAGFGPSESWQQRQTADFFDVRQSITHYKARVKRGEIELDTSLKIPARDCVDQWCHLCFGKLIPPRKEQASEGDAPPKNFPTLGYPDHGTMPLLSIICRMDQPTVIQVLSYHVNWMEATGFTHLQGRWFYALLSVIEKPLDPEACSLIRNLARLCSNLRASLESSQDDRLNALNLLICIVARYFEQKDLGDS